MMKRFFIISTFIFVILMIGQGVFSVYAQENCGDPYASDKESQRCCSIDLDRVDFSGVQITTSQDVGGSQKWGCIRVPLLFEACISDLLNTASRNVKTIITRDNALDELAKLGACKNGKPSKLNLSDPECYCVLEDQPGGLKAQLCNTYILGNKGSASVQELLKSKEYLNCVDCFAQTGFWTALGCFYLADFKVFIEKNVLGLGVGLAGTIAFLCIIYAAFSYQTSRGNPEQIKKAQQLLVSCITGLLLIIFSVFILRLIGVNILQIPGFQ